MAETAPVETVTIPVKAPETTQVRVESDGDDQASEASHHSIRSDNTIKEDAIGAEEDDEVEAQPGSKQDHLFAKLDKYIAERFGEKGGPKRPAIPVEELMKHATPDDMWVVINNMVFDCNPFLSGEVRHPGGKSIFTRQLELSGVDANERFVRWHNPGGNGVRRAVDHFKGDLLGQLAKSSGAPPKHGCCCRRRKTEADTS
mmetsp:Transcript_65764/g.157158  ORF Transcript_65764/g.157158 Transcript_65764/m.157158 type:complete len:201 (-) Transcript_65764:50-652(-)